MVLKVVVSFKEGSDFEIGGCVGVEDHTFKRSHLHSENRYLDDSSSRQVNSWRFLN